MSRCLFPILYCIRRFCHPSTLFILLLPSAGDDKLVALVSSSKMGRCCCECIKSGEGPRLLLGDAVPLLLLLWLPPARVGPPLLLLRVKFFQSLNMLERDDTGTGGGGKSGVMGRLSTSAERKLRILPREIRCAPADLGRSVRFTSSSNLGRVSENWCAMVLCALRAPSLARRLGKVKLSDFNAAFSALITTWPRGTLDQSVN